MTNDKAAEQLRGIEIAVMEGATAAWAFTQMKQLLNTRAPDAEAVAHWDAWGIASHVRAELDKQSCPDHWMRIAVDTVVAQLESQPSATAEDLRDAKRYRYMRNSAKWECRNGPGIYWHLPRHKSGTSSEQLDQAIDAAIGMGNVDK